MIVSGAFFLGHPVYLLCYHCATISAFFSLNVAATARIRAEKENHGTRQQGPERDNAGGFRRQAHRLLQGNEVPATQPDFRVYDAWGRCTTGS